MADLPNRNHRRRLRRLAALRRRPVDRSEVDRWREVGNRRRGEVAALQRACQYWRRHVVPFGG